LLLREESAGNSRSEFERVPMVPCRRTCERIVLRVGLLLLGLACSAQAQTCYTGSEIDAPTTKAVDDAARQYFNLSAQGDVAALRANAIPEVAGNFAGIEQAVVDNKQYFAQGQPAETRTFVLDARESKSPLKRADFYCGIYNSPGRVVFSIPGLPPGRYAVTIARVTGKNPITLTMILQETAQNSWKLAGYYARLNSVGAHDGQWFLNRAREYRDKGQAHNAWLYYLTAWDLTAPVNFMGTPQLDKLSDEIQAARPSDVPSAGAPLELTAGGKIFKITDMAGLPVVNEFDVRVQYDTPDAANPALAAQDNLAVSKALVAKFPELRDAFNAVVARAFDDLGHHYTTLTEMKDLK
jgi:hypothetical protein